MNKFPPNPMDQNVIIAALFLAALLLILYVLYLKKRLKNEVEKRINPPVGLKLMGRAKDGKNVYGLCLSNDGDFTIKDINFMDISLTISDAGFKQALIMKIKAVKILKPKEETSLEYTIFDKEGIAVPGITDSIIPHLINEDFSVKVLYTTLLEGRKLAATLKKDGAKFILAKIESIK